ncbi:UDP-N-acetylglucosamine 2-epimerase [Desulfonema limicola]|uniref:UDP-N-acetylglucosamine 2-epimerase (non-hydrolyzing) n=1 Tax=Desulfonema limicola TaxID=45656 RepID=A0A975B5L6_9BACT|nr:UDP-N-acetylglucosamine 2-epimerase (non-hydrolyzing) [Desulfonema limicola]QTA79203.1 UDP-N-acetylglucosamine 2-epimerase [Desulfonema limicola]
MKKISVIFGTRPEAIKLAPVILKLKQNPDFDCRVCVTAQHREMLDQVLEVFGIVPDTDMNLMQPNQTLGKLTSRAIEMLDKYMADEKPDIVLIQGDTTTVFCAALAAFYHQIPVGHVEAGLRTGNIYSPWPEEANRVIASRLCSLHFAPTETNRQNLLNEGISAKNIFITGNTVIDALFLALDKIKNNFVEIPGLSPAVYENRNGKPLVLITGHRRESFGAGFESVCHAISESARRFPETDFIYPVHLNPNVQEPVLRILKKTGLSNVHLINPLPYLPFVKLMNISTFILTDSGGIQEEAAALHKPVLIMRDTTERTEAVNAGTAKLVGTDYNLIVENAALLMNNPAELEIMSKGSNPFGDGRASERIVDICTRFFLNQEGSLK